MASFRSAIATGQLTAAAPAVRSHQGRHAKASQMAQNGFAENVENTHCRGKQIGSPTKIL